MPEKSISAGCEARQSKLLWLVVPGYVPEVGVRLVVLDEPNLEEFLDALEKLHALRLRV